mmetsp:Transcript_13582/g.39556  ORF Transcript_13582/g.39556 Transcript_13582/m.39556 type:complete len:212 (+) Transcript_13582:179-814(+)
MTEPPSHDDDRLSVGEFDLPPPSLTLLRPGQVGEPNVEQLTAVLRGKPEGVLTEVDGFAVEFTLILQHAEKRCLCISVPLTVAQKDLCTLVSGLRDGGGEGCVHVLQIQNIRAHNEVKGFLFCGFSPVQDSRAYVSSRHSHSLLVPPEVPSRELDDLGQIRCRNREAPSCCSSHAQEGRRAAAEFQAGPRCRPQWRRRRPVPRNVPSKDCC